MLVRMRLALCLLVATGAVVGAQAPEEKPVDAGSARVTLSGCLKGRAFTVRPPREDEPLNVLIAPGTVFRLAGSKQVMDEVKKRDRSAVQLTGLVRRNAAPQGMPIAGGRIRIGGMPSNQDPTRIGPARDPLNTVNMFDVESVRVIDGSCSETRR
ncbi:MAG: hypothetical protein AB7I50_16460 [Vicinamibacterales bacterium]